MSDTGKGAIYLPIVKNKMFHGASVVAQLVKLLLKYLLLYQSRGSRLLCFYSSSLLMHLGRAWLGT